MFRDSPRKFLPVLAFSVSILAIGLTSSSTSGQSRISNSDQISDENALVKLLKGNGLHSNSQDETNNALLGLRALAEKHLLKSPETFKILTSYLDFKMETDERSCCATPTGLNDYPAMAALYYAGEPSLSFLANMISEEKEESRKYSNALLTLIYINNLDFRLTYSFLADSAKHVGSGQQREKLMNAAYKVAAYDPID